jgi:hypothetical protein
MSGRKFSVGDHVRVTYSPACPHLVGTITTITEDMGMGYGLGVRDEIWYATNLRDTDGEEWIYPSSSLEPVYDGNETVSWESCAWQPKTIEVAR